MTASTLITHLQSVPPDAKVLFKTDAFGGILLEAEEASLVSVKPVPWYPLGFFKAEDWPEGQKHEPTIQAVVLEAV